MKRMVALLDKSPLPSKTALRARGATSSFSSLRAAAVKSRDCTELGRFTYDACDRLGSCSNEANGYQALYLYLYVSNNSLRLTDPTGLTPIEGFIGGCGIGGTWGAIGSGLANIALIGNFKNYCCLVGCDAAGGCVAGGILGAFPSTWAGCIGSAVGSLVSSLCKAGFCQNDPINACDFFGAVVNAVFGCIGGALGDTDSPAEGVMEAIGLNVATWTGLCDAAGGGGGPGGLGGTACCTFSSGGTIRSETVSCGFGETAASCCADAADGWLWDYVVVASRGGSCGGGW